MTQGERPRSPLTRRRPASLPVRQTLAHPCLSMQRTSKEFAGVRPEYGGGFRRSPFGVISTGAKRSGEICPRTIKKAMFAARLHNRIGLSRARREPLPERKWLSIRVEISPLRPGFAVPPVEMTDSRHHNPPALICSIRSATGDDKWRRRGIVRPCKAGGRRAVSSAGPCWLRGCRRRSPCRCGG